MDRRLATRNAHYPIPHDRPIRPAMTPLPRQWAVRLVYPPNCVTFRRAGTLVTCRWSVAVSGRWSDPLVVPVGDADGRQTSGIRYPDSRLAQI